MLLLLPVFALDLDSTVTDKTRQNYGNAGVNNGVNSGVNNGASTASPAVKTEQTPIQKVETPKIKQDLPKVPDLPKNVNSSTVAPINTEYSGKMPNSDALIPCTDIIVKPLVVDESLLKTKTTASKPTGAKQQKQKTVKTTTPKYKTARLARGTQIRAINKVKITDNLVEGQTVVFLSTQEVQTAYFTIPKNTVFTAKVVSSHKPQMTCNGGLVGLRIVSANINGYTQNIDAGIIKMNTNNIHFSNLKGKHTYGKNVGKKAKWGQNICSKWIKTSHNLANKGACIIVAPFPYVAGCVVAAASTVSAPATALLAKGGNLVVPAKTSFTIKLYDDAHLRY